MLGTGPRTRTGVGHSPQRGPLEAEQRFQPNGPMNALLTKSKKSSGTSRSGRHKRSHLVGAYCLLHLSLEGDGSSYQRYCGGNSGTSSLSSPHFCRLQIGSGSLSSSSRMAGGPHTQSGSCICPYFSPSPQAVSSSQEAAHSLSLVKHFGPECLGPVL